MSLIEATNEREDAMLQSIEHMDFNILNFIQSNFKNELLDTVMPLISGLADNGIIWIIIFAVIMLLPKYRKYGAVLFYAILLDIIICNGILKPLIHRIRPYDINVAVSLLIDAPKDYSFPSGHTAISFASATALLWINKKWGSAAFVLAILIGFSRLYLYVHFVSDVVFGAIVGILCGILGIYISKALPSAKIN